jgi:hypothetical protein
MSRKANAKSSSTGKLKSTGGAKAQSSTFESKPRKAVETKPQAGTTRNNDAPRGAGNGRGSGGRLARVASAVKGLFRRNQATPEVMQESAAPPEPVRREPAKAARAPRRTSDIPMDVLANTYTPQMTSGKAGFRSDGSDHQDDQDFASGTADERWNDEDRLTNKSGDPRIGTHGRTYEPGESRDESRSE